MDNKIFGLQEIIEDLVNPDKSLVSALRKLNYFGMQIKNNELVQFTLNELNGYKTAEEVPEYRKALGKIMVDVQTGYDGKQTLEIPASLLDEPFGSVLKYVAIREGIGTIENWTTEFKNSKIRNDTIGRPVPMEMLPYIQPAVSKLYKSNARMDVVGARVITTANIAIEIINTVSTKLLGFAMEMRDDFGKDIEIVAFRENQEKNNQTIINIMKTEINNTGDGNVVNTGDHSTITATITISKGDIDKLNKALEDQGIEKEDIAELNEIVTSEKPDYENKRLGDRANNWVLKIFGKVLNGVGKIATSTSGNLLATMIKQYYGMDN